MRNVLFVLAAAAATSPAVAAETIDLGVIRNQDIAVVQRLLYPKDDRSELGVHLGVMPFDAYLTTPNGQLSFTKHLSERVSVGGVAGGGWGFKTSVYKKLESPAYGVAPYAYRYLGSVLGGVEWTPIYAKMSLNAAKVLHFDIYLAGRAGVSIESSVVPGGNLAIAPTLSPGLGSRVFIADNTALRVELRDDLLLEYRSLTESTHLKQNANVSVGLTFWSKPKSGGRR